jgi:hypothetical protein
MAIRFSCERCGHAIEVDDRFAGLTGHCKHCGHATKVPAPGAEGVGGGLRLRPLADDGESGEGLDPRHAAASGPRVRPLAPEDAARLRSDLIEEAVRDHRPPAVLDPDHRDRAQAARFWLNPHYETRLARFVARNLRALRDWLYVISLVFLALAVVGFVFKSRAVLHLGAVGVVATNIGMLCVGVFYLVVLPFRDSLAKGLGTLLLPPYAVYYWVTRWDAMKKPVVNTLRSFTPILLVGLAYLFYEEAPLIERGVGRVEKAVERGEKALGVAPDSKAATARGPGEPSAAKEAVRVIGGEAKAIEDLARPDPGNATPYE